MEHIKKIDIELFDYDLPDARIAKYPLQQRDESKLLVFDNGIITESVFHNIDHFIPENSLLVANNTKVIHARIEFKKPTGARIEIFCLEPYSPSDYQQIFAQTGQCQWQCIIGNSKKWKEGDLELKIIHNSEELTCKASRKNNDGQTQIIEFSWNKNISFGELLELVGEIPIPPYLNRKSEKTDAENYQTIYSKHKGSVAAPTAGLHFTHRVFENLKEKNIQYQEITLHVGAGTFKPVQTKTIGEHQMHFEQIVIYPTTIPNLINNLGNITAIGTTTARSLETFYWLGVKLLNLQNYANFTLKLDQWEPYELPQNYSAKEALIALQNHIESNFKTGTIINTGIMIAPSYQPRIVDHLITNFHQPKSTLLLLISAFAGPNWKKIYDYALENQFRFLSYGDSCYIKKKEQ